MGGGGGLVLRSQAACMKNRKQTEKEEMAAQTFTTSKWDWKEFAKCFSLSLTVVVTGFVVIIIFTC